MERVVGAEMGRVLFGVCGRGGMRAGVGGVGGLPYFKFSFFFFVFFLFGVTLIAIVLGSLQ